MQISIITLFPDLIQSYLSDALIAKASQNGLMQINVINLRNFSDNAYKSVDDSPFGGGDGMLMRPDILEKALLSLPVAVDKKRIVIYLSPQGKRLAQSDVKTYAGSAATTELVLICGRYAGVDERFIETYVDEEVSIGDYILSGGELPALVFVEAVSRFIPGVLGQLESAEQDSFHNQLLEAPQYTRPQVWNDLKVPDVLLSGHHKKIGEWKQAMGIQQTLNKRPDLLSEENLTPEQKKLLKGLNS
jgi:tRNA (guanine37-N1)-methyltransferase